MTTKIVWRLANRPRPDEVQELFTAGILTKDEAREILFSHETDEDRDKKSLESEIKFLRELVEKLANSPTKIVETIKYVQPTYIHQPWFTPYVTWTSSTSGGYGGTTNAIYSTSGGTSIGSAFASGSAGGGGSIGASLNAQTSASNSFSSIKTF